MVYEAKESSLAPGNKTPWVTRIRHKLNQLFRSWSGISSHFSKTQLQRTAKQTQTQTHRDMRPGLEQIRNFSSQRLQMGAAARQQRLPEKPRLCFEELFHAHRLMLLGRNVCIPFCFSHFFFPSLRHVNLWITSRTTNPARTPYMSSTRFPRILPCCEDAHVLLNITDCFPKQPPFLYSTTCPQPVWNCSLEQRPWVWNNKEGESQLEGGKWKHTWAASGVSMHGLVLKNYRWPGSYFSASSKCTSSIPTTAKHERPKNARTCSKGNRKGRIPA